MLIDWFTVIAQLINFLVLVWLLKRFLYKPVLKAIREREDKIAAQVEGARRAREAAEAAQQEFVRKNREWDQQKKSLWSGEQDAVKAEKEKWLEAARKEAEDLRQKSTEALQQEQQELARSMATRTEQTVFRLTQKLLKDLAGLSWEEPMQRKMLEQLQRLSPADREKLLTDLPGGIPAKVVLRSAFPLTAEQQLSFRQALSQFFSRELTLSVETDPSLISGFALDLGGHTLNWSVADYLDGLEKSARERLDNKTLSPLTDNSPQV